MKLHDGPKKKMCAIHKHRRGVAAHQGEVLAELQPIKQRQRKTALV